MHEPIADVEYRRALNCHFHYRPDTSRVRVSCRVWDVATRCRCRAAAGWRSGRRCAWCRRCTPLLTMHIVLSCLPRSDIRRIAAAHGRFTRIHQVATVCAIQSASALYWSCPCRVASNISTAGHVQACPPAESFSPAKLPLRVWEPRSPSNTRFLEPTKIKITNGITIVSAGFARLMIVTDRLTDRQTTLLHLQQ